MQLLVYLLHPSTTPADKMTSEDEAPEAVALDAGRAAARLAAESQHRAASAARQAVRAHRRVAHETRATTKAEASARRSEREVAALAQILAARPQKMSVEQCDEVVPAVVVRPRAPRAPQAVAIGRNKRVAVLCADLERASGRDCTRLLSAREEMLRTRTAVRRVSIAAATASSRLYRPAARFSV